MLLDWVSCRDILILLSGLGINILLVYQITNKLLNTLFFQKNNHQILNLIEILIFESVGIV